MLTGSSTRVTALPTPSAGLESQESNSGPEFREITAEHVSQHTRPRVGSGPAAQWQYCLTYLRTGCIRKYADLLLSCWSLAAMLCDTRWRQNTPGCSRTASYYPYEARLHSWPASTGGHLLLLGPTLRCLVWQNCKSQSCFLTNCATFHPTPSQRT